MLPQIDRNVKYLTFDNFVKSQKGVIPGKLVLDFEGMTPFAAINVAMDSMQELITDDGFKQESKAKGLQLENASNWVVSFKYGRKK